MLLGLVALAVVGVDATAAVSSRGQSPVSATTVTAAAAPAASSAPAAPKASPPAAPKRAAAARPRVMWVRVPAANVWWRLSDVRRVDRPSLGGHPDLRRWVRRQSYRQRLALGSRLMTQALRGEQVVVEGTHGTWAHVRILDQRGSVYRWGIVGWMPRAQLTSRPVKAALQRLPRRASSLIHAARAYLGAPYIFGGMSRTGIDCSGLTFVAARELGVTLPRDAADQSRVGRPVARRMLRPGDLVFFGPGGRRTIHHVGIYVGHGRVLHAPHTGSSVRITPLSAFGDYWGARRIVPAG